MPITLKMEGVTYTVDEKKMPYFLSWHSFTSQQAKSANSKPTDAADIPEHVHSPVPFFAAVQLAVEKGFRTFFKFQETSGLGTDMKNYITLVDTLNLLCVDVLGGLQLDGILSKLKAVNKTGTEDRRPRYAIREAQDAAFILLYKMLSGGPDLASNKAANTIYNAVLFVVSHPRTFGPAIRKMIREVHADRYVATEKQSAALAKWFKLGQTDERRECYCTTSDEEALSNDYYSAMLDYYDSEY